MNIKELINRMVTDKIPMQVLVGKVISVNADEMTCDVDLQGSPDMQDVRIRSVIDSDNSGILIEPAVDSYVLVGLIENRKESAFICAYGTVDSIKLITDSIHLSGDEFGGLIKINDLVDKINTIENAVNQLKTEFNAHTHVSPPAPTTPVNTAPPTVPSTVNLINTTVPELENEKVKHG